MAYHFPLIIRMLFAKTEYSRTHIKKKQRAFPLSSFFHRMYFVYFVCRVKTSSDVPVSSAANKLPRVTVCSRAFFNVVITFHLEYVCIFICKCITYSQIM